MGGFGNDMFQRGSVGGVFKLLGLSNEGGLGIGSGVTGSGCGADLQSS